MAVTDNDRPPYVTFERRPVEDRQASIAAGHYVSQDLDIAVITRPGSRDTLEKPAEVWLKDLAEKVRKQEFPRQWYDAFLASYNAWKSGEELPTQGTPIRGWPVLSPATMKDLLAAGIRTVEDLAALPESEFSVIGTGALSLKAKARAWLDSAEDKGKVVEQVTALTEQVRQLVELTKAQAAEIEALRKQLPRDTAATSK